MDSKPEDRFLRISNGLFDALLQARLSGAQWRILLWVIRQTLGWNRNTTPFSWYRIARDLALDRGGVVRAGHELIGRGILHSDDGQLGIQEDSTLWQQARLVRPENDAVSNVSDDRRHRKAMTGVTATDDDCQRNRCQPSSLFRRAKDRCKDTLKTYKNRRASAPHHVGQNGHTERRHLAGAAHPIPGKYDSLSQN
jgi:phage replication O-like protein O